jgi:putative endonuclease
MSQWVVYIIECADATLYTGITTNLEKRIENHNKKLGAKYTATRIPVKLVWSETVATRSAALKRELALKSLSRKDKIDLIKNSPKS